MNDQSDNRGLSGVFIGLGVLLVVLGTLFSVGQAAGFELGRFGWPFFVIVPGLVVFGVGLAASDPPGGRITLVGAAVTMVGLILLYQNAADHFESWAYAWALVFPTSTGLGRMAYGSLRGSKEMVATGGRMAAIGAALFVVGGFFFEFAIGIGGYGLGLGGYGLPPRMVIAGALPRGGGLLSRRK